MSSAVPNAVRALRDKRAVRKVAARGDDVAGMVAEVCLVSPEQIETAPVPLGPPSTSLPPSPPASVRAACTDSYACFGTAAGRDFEVPLALGSFDTLRALRAGSGAVPLLTPRACWLRGTF